LRSLTVFSLLGIEENARLDTRWVPVSISVAAFQEWSRAGCPGTIPLRCRLLARTLREVLGPDNPEPTEDVLARIERETVAWADLSVAIERPVRGRKVVGVCTGVTIIPTLAGGVPNVPKIPVDNLIRLFVTDIVLHSSVVPGRRYGPEKRKLLCKVASVYQAAPGRQKAAAVVKAMKLENTVNERNSARQLIWEARDAGLLGPVHPPGGEAAAR
jgi:hypothetical protein